MKSGCGPQGLEESLAEIENPPAEKFFTPAGLRAD